MTDAGWKKFIKKAHDEYKMIGSIPCPAFGGELVYFNKHGWNHLIRKGRITRERKEQMLRIELSKNVSDILKSIKHFSSHTINPAPEKSDTVVHFWSLLANVKNKHVTIIIRQLVGKDKHFFSIFPTNRV